MGRGVEENRTTKCTEARSEDTAAAGPSESEMGAEQAGDYRVIEQKLVVSVIHAGITPLFFTERLYNLISHCPNPSADIEEIEDWEVRQMLQKQRACLYNVSCSWYHDRVKKDAAWKEIAEELQLRASSAMDTATTPPPQTEDTQERRCRQRGQKRNITREKEELNLEREKIELTTRSAMMILMLYSCFETRRSLDKRCDYVPPTDAQRLWG
ncbi:hypothetical protein QQF64_033912 [Cirrhinus molitorella]|uniref:MADF domain-containing protein n=1 Tax=Cirrhinus molitorella TaxID=172907 RepID=A0ABR3MV72_9TELE